MAKAPLILLVNPWITDFAAYDLWAKPLGLLLIASLLREGGCGVALVDCLDRFDLLTRQHPEIQPGVDRPFGTGKYPKLPIQKPRAYADMPRRYYRHGIHPESLARKLAAMPKPDLIWVTSIMTYWYPGVQQTIARVREAFADVPIWLGGIYARLCTPHALANSGADEVVTVPLPLLAEKLEGATGFAVRNKASWASLHAAPAPALDLLPHPTYAPVLTSSGCPFSCPYCASRILQPVWERRSSSDIYTDIRMWYDAFGIRDFAFYDDALLLGAETTLKHALERIRAERLPVRFHTPNALHIRALTPDWCALLYESGFTTIRLGLETSRADRQKEWGGKVETKMFHDAVKHLCAAGFRGSQLGVYLLCGLPGQSPDDVREAIELVENTGVQPYLAEYSPVPGTAMWTQAVAASNYPLAAEPLYQNNSFFACRRPDFSYQDLTRLKELAGRVRRANQRLDPATARFRGQ